MTALERAREIAAVLDSKKGEEIKILHIGDLTTIGDYFVVVNGTSTSQVRALADAVDEKMSSEGIEPKRIEGYQSCSWILMDYHDVIVHIFLKETREFYALERLWGDAPEVDTGI
jgi:ribosome-associated protein